MTIYPSPSKATPSLNDVIETFKYINAGFFRRSTKIQTKVFKECTMVNLSKGKMIQKAKKKKIRIQVN